MREPKQRLCLQVAATMLLLTSAASLRAQDAAEVEAMMNELRGAAARTPACKTTSTGFPRRVIISANGTGLFASPEKDAKPISTLPQNKKLFLYEEGQTGGYHRVGNDAFKGPEGYVPVSLCIPWDWAQVIFLDQQSFSQPGDKIQIWKTKELAIEGDEKKTSFNEIPGDPNRFKKLDIPLPVVQKDESNDLYEVAIVTQSAKASNMHGETLTPKQREVIAENLTSVNIVLCIDATDSMGPYLEEVKAKATQILDAIDLTKATDMQRRELKITTRFALVAYRDDGSPGFAVKRFVDLTTDRAAIRSSIQSLDKGSGIDWPERVERGVTESIGVLGGAARGDSNRGDEGIGVARGAINRIILIGDAETKPDVASKSLDELGQRIKGSLAVLDALHCGDNEDALKCFEKIAKPSGGKVLKLADASKLSDMIMAQIANETKVLGAPVSVDEKSRKDGISSLDAARELGFADDAARQVVQILEERGAASGDGVKTGWMKVKAGASRVRILQGMPRWQFEMRMAAQIRLNRTVMVTEEAKAAAEFTQLLQDVQAGGQSNAAMDKMAQSTAQRGGKELPEASPAVKAGAQRMNKKDARERFEPKLRESLLYARTAKEHDGWIYLPLDLVP